MNDIANDVQAPLCVQLEGALTPANTLHEKLLALIKGSPRKVLSLLGSLRRGPGSFWRTVAAAVPINPDSLPLRQDVLDWLREQRQQGRRMVLLAEHDVHTATQLAQSLQLFDDVQVTDRAQGPSGAAKHEALLRLFGPRGFDFVGTDAAQAQMARRVFFIGNDSGAARIARTAEVAHLFPVEKPSIRTWIKALRLYQWVKNALIFLPALLAHTVFAPHVLTTDVLAFIAFGLCASSVYVLNDLFDLASDRSHPRKRRRPFAAGVLSVRSGLIATALLLCSAAAVAATVNPRFIAVLAGYYVLTWSYSLRLKRIGMVDVMTLAGLYTIRIIAGAAAASVSLSFWLLAFSVFMFLSLGFVKRYAELDQARRANTEGGGGRGYSGDDLPLIMSLGTAAGYCSIVVMALYLNSNDSQALYHRHKVLWLICPLMLYWVSRVWTQTSRGLMHDDPVVFAIRDRASLMVLCLLGLIVLAAV
jgi:4-hydroxybenzoate polyprenyltransferase